MIPKKTQNVIVKLNLFTDYGLMKLCLACIPYWTAVNIFMPLCWLTPIMWHFFPLVFLVFKRETSAVHPTDSKYDSFQTKGCREALYHRARFNASQTAHMYQCVFRNNCHCEKYVKLQETSKASGVRFSQSLMGTTRKKKKCCSNKDQETKDELLTFEQF